QRNGPAFRQRAAGGPLHPGCGGGGHGCIAAAAGGRVPDPRWHPGHLCRGAARAQGHPGADAAGGDFLLGGGHGPGRVAWPGAGPGPARHVDGPDCRPVGGRGAAGRALPVAQRAAGAGRPGDVRRIPPGAGGINCAPFPTHAGSEMNEPRRRGPIARVLVGIWDAMNFTRRLIFNLLFFALLLFVLALLASGESTRPLLERTTLVIAPQGRIVEQYSIDPVSRALARLSGDRASVQVQLRDILRAIEAAKDDERIERVYLNLDGLQPSGIATMRE